MRLSSRPSWGCALLGACLGSLAVPAFAQETSDETPPKAPPAAEAPEKAARIRALKVGTVHPVSGPAIAPGVVVMRGDRIAAVGAPGDVEIPADAEIIDLPGTHAYPGLVDALTTAFADPRALADTSTNAGSRLSDGLDPFDPIGRSLVAAGVTTIFIGTDSATTWRGQGVIVRPTRDGFRSFGEPAAGAVQLLLGKDPDAHPLERQNELRGVASAFEGLETYEHRRKRHAESIAKYETKFEEYLEWHRKNKARSGRNRSGAGRPTPAGENSGGRARRTGGREGAPSQGGEGQRRRRPDGTGGERGERGTGRPNRDAGGDAGGANRPRRTRGTAGAAGTASPAAAGPKRPEYPKPLREDDAKQALLDVRAGKLALRVEAHTPDAILTAIDLAREQRLPRVVLDGATHAAAMSGQLRDAGIAVVISDVLEPNDDDVDVGALPGELIRGGVDVCLASGNARAARHLPLVAAYACGKGMDADAAVRAITLQAARILGIEASVGSLEPDKLADIIVTSGPLLATDSRVLRVFSGGETQFEEKK